MGIGVILRDAQNAHQAGLRAAAARAEGIAPCDAAAQPKQKTEHRIRGMNEQAEQIGRMLAPLAESAQVTMTLTLGEGCLVRCNDKDAGQILKNLMENAIKYNVLHGQVDVTTRRVGDQVMLSVADTGVGIPEADMPRIFERFYRVDKARSRAAGGTGLGLSIVRDAVKRHGGEITVQAGQPAGTIFTVTLPAWTGEGETT